MLTLVIENERKYCTGVIEVGVLLNGKRYTYPITSAYALEKVKRLLRGKHPKPGKALHVLSLFKIKEEEDGSVKAT